ncbi:phosphatidate cytidylyltransferase [Bacteroidales bacterium KA00251]|nr:phosphatidate cytidylyltransferase [Bacteroidales bacterium KA00251]
MKISISSSHALLKRSISGIAYVSLILLALLLKNGIFFFILFSFFAICAVIEYNMMSGISRKRPFRVAIDACAVVWVFLMGYMINSRTYTLAVWVPLVAYLFYIFARSLFSDEGNEIRTICNSVFPLVYIGLPFFIASLISFYPRPFEETLFSGARVLSVFIIVWGNDTGAYIIGSLFGKTPLFPRLSPHKTIEGFVGGLLTSTLLGVLMTCFFPDFFGHHSIGVMLLYGLMIGLLADLGDLFESMLKRRSGVKDSGSLIPGHGGVLDRIDSFLFAIAGSFIVTATFLPL